ncbi:MAG: hypothetical protein AAF823_05620 [Planctomycetota bacterium]
MSVRSFLNNNPAVMTIGAIVVLLVCLAVIYNNLGGGGARAARDIDFYYYDEGTGEVFTASGREIPPIDAPSGPRAGARAVIYGCGSCDPSTWTIAYIEKYSDAAHAAIQNDPEGDDAMMAYQEGLLMRSPDSDEWFTQYSEGGMTLIESVSSICPGGDARRCMP